LGRRLAVAGGRSHAARIRSRGFHPTLTGLGERLHLANPDIGLDTHIQDILMVLEYEQLRDVILLGYSYSGMVVTGVAESAAERISQLIYLDAFVPQDGQSLLDILGPGVAAFIQQATQAYGDGWRIPHDPPDAPRRTPHPLKTGLQPVRLANPTTTALHRR
jgi:pimeloyl-ACP methyl ester carboxylesterase